MYTLITHFIIHICFCTTLWVLSIAHEHIFLIDETFFPEFHSGLIWIQTVFANVNGERERDWYMHILSGKSKYIDRSTSRERETEREVFFLNFVIFLTLRTRLHISKFRVYLCKKFRSTRLSLSDFYMLNGICADGEQAKAFCFFF